MALLDMLRGLAARGEIDAMVVVASRNNGNVMTALSTPENNMFRILGAMEAAKHDILTSLSAERPIASYD